MNALISIYYFINILEREKIVIPSNTYIKSNEVATSVTISFLSATIKLKDFTLQTNVTTFPPI